MLDGQGYLYSSHNFDSSSSCRDPYAYIIARIAFNKGAGPESFQSGVKVGTWLHIAAALSAWRLYCCRPP